MAGVNKVILVGNLGIDPEIRTFENGNKVARLSLATSEAYTNKEGARIEETEWHSVTLWRGLAELAEKYLKKGNKVYIEGKLRTRSYTDKEGVQKYTTEIIGENIQFFGGHSGDSENSARNTNTQSQNQAAQSQPATSENTDDNEKDLPF